jgi:hypothetical protein
MSYFKDLFENHEIHKTLEEIDFALDPGALEDITEDEVIAIARCQHVVDFVKNLLDKCDVDLVTANSLTKLNDQLKGFLSSWNQFCENRNYKNLIPSVDEILVRTASFSSVKTPVPEDYTVPLDSFRSNIAEMLRQIREANVKQNEEIEKFNSRLAELEESVELYESQLESQKTRIDNLIEKHQNTFTTSQNSKTEEFTQFISNIGLKFREFQEEHATQLDELYENKSAEGEKRIETLQEHCDHAKKIVDIISNVGITGNYQKIADQEKKTANKLRIIAITFFSAAVIAGIAALVGSFRCETFSWEMALFRVVAAGIFTAPGIYCATESSKHRRKEQENRKLELELASITPFLEKLKDDEEAKGIRVKLAHRYFGNHVSEDSEGTLSHINLKQIEPYLKQLIELIKAVK